MCDCGGEGLVHFKVRTIERFMSQLATAYTLYDRGDKRAWEFVALVASDLRVGLHEFHEREEAE